MSEENTERRSENYGPTGKRLDYITWNEHHMLIAEVSEDLCENEQNRSACLIVDREDYIIGSGHEGETYLHESHSINIALSNKTTPSAENCVIYTTKFPNCEECLNLIIKEKIGNIYHLDDANLDDLEKLESANIVCDKYIKTRKLVIQVES